MTVNIIQPDWLNRITTTAQEATLLKASHTITTASIVLPLTGLGCHIVQLQCIPVACIQCLLQFDQTSHHTQFPTVHYSTPPLDPDWCMHPGTNESGFDKGCPIFW